MEMRHLRYFLAVAEELSFSKAARRLHIAQPAISRAIKELEEELGVELLARTRRSVAMTAAGSILRHETESIFQRLEETARRVRRIASGEEGELRLGYIGPPTQGFLGRILKEFRERHPRVTVVLEERTPERVWEMVAQGRLALGLTRPVHAHRTLQLHTTLLRRERLCAAVPRDHPLAAKDSLRWPVLADQPLVLLSRREGASLHDAVLAACRRARFTPKLAHTPSLLTTVFSYVEAGAGIGIVTDSSSSIAQGLALEIRPLQPAQTVDLVLVWSETGDCPPAAAFRRLIAEWKSNDKLFGTPS
jgi:DNA-binding transcriptional LysR family regulator